jgi:hypothetical protein
LSIVILSFASCLSAKILEFVRANKSKNYGLTVTAQGGVQELRNFYRYIRTTVKADGSISMVM